MIFTGQSELAIDSKQRLAIPAKYRNQWSDPRDGAAWVCVPWDRALRFYTEAHFNRLAGAFPSTLAPGGNLAEFDRLVFGNAERLEMDTAGRVTLPKRQLDLTGIGEEVVMVGARDRLEVHDKREWERQGGGRPSGLPTLIENMNKLGEIPVIHETSAPATDSAGASVGKTPGG